MTLSTGNDQNFLDRFASEVSDLRDFIKPQDFENLKGYTLNDGGARQYFLEAGIPEYLLNAVKEAFHGTSGLAIDQLTQADQIALLKEIDAGIQRRLSADPDAEVDDIIANPISMVREATLAANRSADANDCTTFLLWSVTQISPTEADQHYGTDKQSENMQDFAPSGPSDLYTALTPQEYAKTASGPITIADLKSQFGYTTDAEVREAVYAIQQTEGLDTDNVFAEDVKNFMNPDEKPLQYAAATPEAQTNTTPAPAPNTGPGFGMT